MVSLFFSVIEYSGKYLAKWAHRQVYILEINFSAEIPSFELEGTTYLIFNYSI